jgi:hypothetical protein
VKEFVAAWNKVMNLDRYDIAWLRGDVLEEPVGRSRGHAH